MGDEESCDDGKKGKPLSPLVTECIREIRLKNGMILHLSTLDAKQLGMWFCSEKRHHKCKCTKLRKYGKVELVSETYMKPKAKSIMLE